jgi:hypothetical protein
MKTVLRLTNFALALVFCISLLPAPQAEVIHVRPPVHYGIECNQEVPEVKLPPVIGVKDPVKIIGPEPTVPDQDLIRVDPICKQPPEGGGYIGCPPTCPTVAEPRGPPAFPPPAPLANRLIESLNNATSTDHDGDADGIPDTIDAVNLPSEAQTLTTSQDNLDLAEGLPQAGFALLIEPGHREAQFLVADPASLGTSLLNPGTITAQQALNQVESLQGVASRNALAMVLNDAMTLTYTPIAPEAPWNQPLTWSTTLPADGTWLLIQTDPTRLVDLTLAGQTVSLASRAASHFSSPLNATDYRWQFLNLHSGLNFCYDPTTFHNGTDCQGQGWPGWIRAYSGQAAYALEAANAGLEAGTISLTTLLPDVTQKLVAESCPSGSTGVVIGGQDACLPVEAPSPDPSGNGPTSAPVSAQVRLPLVEPGSPWQVLGNESYAFPAGIGVDYALDPVGFVSQASQVTQVADSMLSNATQGIEHAAEQRLFKFQGGYYSTPTDPRDITRVRLGIESLDGNEAAQTFLIDGKRLQDLLDLRTGDNLTVNIDSAHEEGFAWVAADVNGDGATDLVVKVPHFSQAWLDIGNDNQYDTFWTVKLTTPTTGWVAGTKAVYRYASGHLTRFNLPIPSDHLYVPIGLHVVNDYDFWVAGAYDASYWTSSGYTPCFKSFIAHYHDASLSKYGFTLQTLPDSVQGSCDTMLASIWFNADQSLGYASGSKQTGNIWLKFTGTAGSGSWATQSPPFLGVNHDNCKNLRVDSFDFDASGHGPVSSWTCWGMYQFDGTYLTNTATSDFAVYKVRGGWAVGSQAEGNSHIFQRGTSWRPSAESGVPLNTYYWDLAKTGTLDSIWFAGEGSLANRKAGVWSTIDLSGTTLYGIDFSDNLNGLAVGVTLMQFLDVDPPVAAGSLSLSSTDTMSTVTADGTASSQAQGRPLTHAWSWGDGTATAGVTSSHRYDTPGTYTVVHLVTDKASHLTTMQNLTVTVTATTLNVGGSVTGSLPTATSPAGNAFVIPATAGDRYVALTLAGTGLSLSASLDTPPPMTVGAVMASGSWPTAGSLSASQLVGKIPANHPLYISVQKPSGVLISYSLSAATVAPPAAPTTTLTAGTYATSVGFTASTVAGERSTQLVLTWGDGATTRLPDGFQGPTTYTTSHAYATSGAFTVQITAQDDVGQVASITRAVTIHQPPQGTPTGATAITTVQATLNGQLTSLGGTSSVSVVYKLYRGGDTPVATSPTLTATTEGAPLPPWTATGLQSGSSYTYTVTLTNDAASTTTPAAVFETQGLLSIVPVVIADSGPVNLGTQTSLTLKASAAYSNNVAYLVRWQANPLGMYSPTSKELRYPSTGYVPWNQAVTATRILPFAGVHNVEVRIEDSTLSRSATTTLTETVNGAVPISSLSYTSDATSFTLSTTVGGLGVSPVRLRLGIQNPATLAWSWQTFQDAYPGGTYTWVRSAGAINPALTYKAAVDLYFGSDQQSWSTPAAQQIQVHTDRIPTLTAGTLAASVNYLDPVRFNVTYRDEEGYAPTTSPTALVNGVSYVMAPAPLGDYKAGVEYHAYVTAGALLQGQSYTPTYNVTDQYARTTTARGAPVFVTKSFVANLGFETDTLDGAPQGMALGGQPLNYWHVVDTQASTMPNRIALGHHGKALWFGTARGTYQDPRGGAPTGTVSLPPLDLRSVLKPSLSFSSFYETEDLGATRDLKLVEARTGTGAWTALHQVSGYQGGFGAWRTQHVDLAAYAGQTVEVRFRFDATDEQANNYFGWFIDDIAIGHDQDNDTLPDILEQTRNDVLVASQPAPVLVLPGASGTSYVRRLMRPAATSYQLEALVGTSTPSTVKVTIGVTPSLDDNQQHSFELFSSGINHASCLTTSSNGIESYQDQPAVTVRSDGLDVKIDLVKCAASLPGIPAGAFAAPRNWFLNVEIPSSSSVAWIDLLRIVTSGHTDYLDSDTNHDGSTDGENVNLLHDALGHDADQDGIANTIDPDDTIPSWAPALRVYSNDYTKRMEVSFQDLAVPLSAMNVVARYNTTGQRRDLPATYHNAATWSVNPNQYNQFPDALEVHWRDVYGTKGTITYYMGPQDTAVFVPKAVAAEATDQATQQTITMTASLNGASDRSAVYFGTATPYASSYDGHDYLGQLMSVIGLPLIAQEAGSLAVAAGRTVVGCLEAIGDWFMNTVVTTVVSAVVAVGQAVDNTVNGFKFVVKKTRDFAAATAAEVQQAMEFGKVFLDNAGNIIMIKVANNKYIIAVGRGVGDGVVLVWEVVTWIPEGLAGAYDQLWTEIGYGSDCGADVINGVDHNTNPIDELDTSCFIHDECLKQRRDSVLPPFSHDPQTKGCNERLVSDATHSDCHLAVTSLIRIVVPEVNPSDGLTPPRYTLPQGAPPLYVQPAADPGPITGCTANRPAIISIFSIGLLVVSLPPPPPMVLS